MPLALALHGPGRGKRRAAPLSCCQHQAAAGVKAAAGARAGANVGAAGGRPRRRAGGGAATGGGVMTAVGRRGKNVSARFCAMENCWAKLSTASPERPAWEIGESRKRLLVGLTISARSSHRSFLDHQSGHRLTEGDRACDFRCMKGKVRRCAQFLYQTWVRTALVQLLQRLGLVGCRRAMACRAEAACPAAL